MAEAGDQRTEAPSAKRLARAREEGTVAISRELQSFAALGISVAILMTVDPEAAERFLPQMRGFMENSFRIDVSSVSLRSIWLEMARSGAAIAGPVLLATWAAIVAASMVQTGFLFNRHALSPKLGRLNPLKGFGRIFGGQTAAEAAKSVAKLSAFGYATWHVLAGLFAVLLHAEGLGAAALVGLMMRLTAHAVLIVIAVQGVVTVLDVGWVQYRHRTSLRMSRQELRDEYRESEGDPHVKGRIRQLRKQRAARRMMQSVPKATVVVTNPTHYAVALVYESGTKAAPRIVAKGMDELAARIRALAQDNKVPLVSNPPLARALYALPVDSEIPREYFQAVAGIIAYVWRLRSPPAGGPPVR